jgi:hypothetical protein
MPRCGQHNGEKVLAAVSKLTQQPFDVASRSSRRASSSWKSADARHADSSHLKQSLCSSD